MYGMLDRGVIEEGYLADLNVIDMGSLTLKLPWVAHDLPAGGKRLLQEATGYRFTVKSGQVTFIDGRYQGKTPGSLIRGPQPSPSTASHRVAATD